MHWYGIILSLGFDARVSTIALIPNYELPINMPLNFQQVILTLQQFWADRGAIVWQPYYTQVGAGTMNPATFLRVLGPEPWNVA